MTNKERDIKVGEILDNMEAGFQQSLCSASSFADRKYAKVQALSQLNAIYKPQPDKKMVEEIRRIIINKELTPTIAEDSGQAEWTVGESRKLAQAIVSYIQTIKPSLEDVVVDEVELAAELHLAGLDAYQHPDNRSGYDWDKYRLKIAKALSTRKAIYLRMG